MFALYDRLEFWNFKLNKTQSRHEFIWWGIHHLEFWNLKLNRRTKEIFKTLWKSKCTIIHRTKWRKVWYPDYVFFLYSYFLILDLGYWYFITIFWSLGAFGVFGKTYFPNVTPALMTPFQRYFCKVFCGSVI